MQIQIQIQIQIHNHDDEWLAEADYPYILQFPVHLDLCEFVDLEQFAIFCVWADFATG